MIDWTNASDQVTEHFTVGDALTLHSWNRLATEADGADFTSLTTLCNKMEEIRSLLDCPINVHCMLRSQAYNQAQGISPIVDVHSLNMACDFDCSPNLTTDQVKAILEPQLKNLGIRMENNGAGASWVHVDLHPVISSRYFNV